MRLRTLLVIAMCTGLPRGARAAAPTRDVQLADERFQTGRRLYKEGRFAEALAAFREAQAQVASPNVRLYIGRCLLALNQPVEAYEELAATRREAAALKSADPKYAQTEAAAAEEASAVAKRLGQLKLVLVGAPPDAQIRVAGREVALAELGQPVRVVPGKVLLQVDAPGYARIAQTLELGAGQSEEVRIELQKLAPTAGPRPQPAQPVQLAAPPAPTVALEPRTPAWAQAGTWGGLAVAAVGGAAFGGFYFAAENQHRKLVAECVDQSCSADRSTSLRDGGRTLQTWTNVSLAVGAAGLALGAGSFLLGRALPEEVPVALSTNGRGVLLSARF